MEKLQYHLPLSSCFYSLQSNSQLTDIGNGYNHTDNYPYIIPSEIAYQFMRQPVKNKIGHNDL